MSTPSDSTLKGKVDEVAGKIKQGVGDTFNDQSLANKGAAQEVKGHGEQAWGSVKEAASDTKDRHAAEGQHEAHNLRDTITSAAENVKEHVEAGVDSFKNKH